MRRHRFILLAWFAFAAFVLLLLWQANHRATVQFQGKTVREWARGLYLGATAQQTNEATIAFQTMGAATVPELRALLLRQDPPYKKLLLKYIRYFPPPVRSYLFPKIRLDAAEYRVGAIRALGILGTNAAPALPDFMRILTTPDSPECWVVAQNISALGSEAITSLIPLATNTEVRTRHASVYALGQAKSNALPAVTVLIMASMDTNETVRASAFYSLSQIGSAAVPIVVDLAVTNSDPQLRSAAFNSLAILRPPPGSVMTSSLAASTNSTSIRRMAYQSLWFARQTNAHALKLLTAGLTDEDESVRKIVQHILTRIAASNAIAPQPQ